MALECTIAYRTAGSGEAGVDALKDLAGRVAASGDPLLMNDYAHWPDRAQVFASEPISAAACIPLRWAGTVLGALEILDDRPGRSFAREDMQLLAQLEPQASLSIRNAEL